jgi:hypothetical protein
MNVVNGMEKSVSFIDFTTGFKYLGSITHHPIILDADVHNSASTPSGILKNIYIKKRIGFKVKEGISDIDIAMF